MSIISEERAFVCPFCQKIITSKSDSNFQCPECKKTIHETPDCQMPQGSRASGKFYDRAASSKNAGREEWIPKDNTKIIVIILVIFIVGVGVFSIKHLTSKTHHVTEDSNVPGHVIFRGKQPAVFDDEAYKKEWLKGLPFQYDEHGRPLK